MTFDEIVAGGYPRKSIRRIRRNYASLDEFLTVWRDAKKKLAVIEPLVDQSVFLVELAEQVGKDLSDV